MIPTRTCALALLLACLPHSIQAQAVFFETSFDSDTESWRDASFMDVTHTATGGVDGGGYISTDFAFADLPTGAMDLVLFRGQDEFNASGNGFVGNWIAEGVSLVTMSVRHNSPVPLTFGARFSSPANFPGASAIDFVPVLPNQWTEITLPINPTSPQFVTFENTSFEAVFSSIGHIQVNAGVPMSLAGSTTPFTFDLDEIRVTVIPEPSTLTLVWLSGLALGSCRSRRA